MARIISITPCEGRFQPCILGLILAILAEIGAPKGPNMLILSILEMQIISIILLNYMLGIRGCIVLR